MKVLGITAILSAVAAVVSARHCPLESDCIQKSCKNFRLPVLPSDALNLGLTWELTADCKDNAGKKTVTKLYLEECLANLDGNLTWGEGLSPPPPNSPLQTLPNNDYSPFFRCTECKLTKTDPLIMECLCKNKRGKEAAREVNLSEGIWVYDGAIGCYDTGAGSSIADTVLGNYNAGIRKSPSIGEY
ncbi:putative CVNH domain-containing protein [Colletotrichum sublineola]|uniref:Putative CVNH domain-containing protein n=1 Tax=Colletotrichum sublineola TaxID=1173701 RepID=A0A066X047_COLSU|nr:putative CVNH domain-containing protein [Colletotrichum sublineola]